MILYCIRRKSDGRYFIHTDGNGHPRMSTDPVFFKKPETIARNLKRLCSEFTLVQSSKFKWSWSKEWSNFNPDILDAYEVERYELHLQDKIIVPARNFVGAVTMQNLNTRIR